MKMLFVEQKRNPLNQVLDRDEKSLKEQKLIKIRVNLHQRKKTSKN